jgi:hypothetical protein
VTRAHPLRSPQPEQSKPTSTPPASFRQNPQTPAPAPKPPDAAPFPQSGPAPSPTRTQPSTVDPDQKPLEPIADALK